MRRTTIEGVYENGVVTLSEQPPTEEPMKVMVVFVEEKKIEPIRERKPGFLKGFVNYMAPDFDEPLEWK